MPNKTALITGVTGQDGGYLAEHLLNIGYKVVGMTSRRTNQRYPNLDRCMQHPEDRFRLVYGDMTDAVSLNGVMQHVKPDEIYNLAAQSYVGISWDMPYLTHDVNAVGFIRLLEAARLFCPGARIYQASSSEMFGGSGAPQSEHTALKPNSPYAVSKVTAHLAAKNYRDSYGMFVSCGILFNHESERRGSEFVTQKIAMAVAQCTKNRDHKLTLGNMEAKRDWGYAPEYVAAMHLMLRHDEPDDFVIGTGHAISVRALVGLAFRIVNLDVEDHLVIDPKLIRPVDVPILRADCTKAKRVLGWEPQMQAPHVMAQMIQHQIKKLEKRNG